MLVKSVSEIIIPNKCLHQSMILKPHSQWLITVLLFSTHTRGILVEKEPTFIQDIYIYIYNVEANSSNTAHITFLCNNGLIIGYIYPHLDSSSNALLWSCEFIDAVSMFTDRQYNMLEIKSRPWIGDTGLASICNTTYDTGWVISFICDITLHENIFGELGRPRNTLYNVWNVIAEYLNKRCIVHLRRYHIGGKFLQNVHWCRCCAIPWINIECMRTFTLDYPVYQLCFARWYISFHYYSNSTLLLNI